MTDAQAKWLRDNPEYQIVGAGGASPSRMTIDPHYRNRRVLMGNGVTVTGRPADPDRGDLLVGIRKPPPER